jgi:hypothetical protein
VETSILVAVVKSLPVIVQTMPPEGVTNVQQITGSSSADVVTAVSTAVLAAAAVIAGLIALRQLRLSDKAWRIKNTFSIVNAYTVRTEHGPSPMEAKGLLLAMSRARLSSLEPGSPEAITLRETLSRGSRYYIILKNYFDEADDLFRRNFVDRGFFLSRLSVVIWEGAQSLRRFAPLVQARYVDEELIARLETMAEAYYAKRKQQNSESGMSSLP